MAVVKGIRENVHFPLYDAVELKAPAKKPPDQDDPNKDIALQISRTGNIIKFFVNIQNKTKLETNQQEAGVLSHYNTFEARAMRVVIQPPLLEEMEMKKDEPGKKDYAKQSYQSIYNGSAKRLNTLFLCNFIYNSVTSFIVGEKVMIQCPTWFFPSGAGPSNDDSSTNGEPSPEATFRFAEPVFVSHQQNFRVEIEFPRGVDDFKDVVGPAKVWVVVDGYLRRDVQ